MKKKILFIILACFTTLSVASCGNAAAKAKQETSAAAESSTEAVTDESVTAQTVLGNDSSLSDVSTAVADTSVADKSVADSSASAVPADTSTAAEAQDASVAPEIAPQETITQTPVYLTDDMEFASFSQIHSDAAILYENHKSNSNGITICVNAGHGTNGGESVRTQCHPDGTPKVTGGSTSEGSTTATAVASGMTFLDGTEERAVTLPAAIILKDRLLDAGYNVLMIRETEDVQLDNIARTVLANTHAQAHVALHWDSTESDKGAFYMKVPSVDSYKSMYPVSETWEKSDQFGECLVQGLGQAGRSIFESGSMEMDLTQTSYSKVPSIDIELGDRASDHSDETLQNIAEGLLMGINAYFGIGGQG